VQSGALGRRRRLPEVRPLLAWSSDSNLPRPADGEFGGQRRPCGCRQLRELAAANEFSGDRRRCGRVPTFQSPRSSQARTASASAGLPMGPTHRDGPTGDRSVEQGCSSTMVPDPAVRAAQVNFPRRHGAETSMPCRQRRML
jgi:hypothetical protein